MKTLEPERTQRPRSRQPDARRRPTKATDRPLLSGDRPRSIAALLRAARIGGGVAC